MATAKDRQRRQNQIETLLGEIRPTNWLVGEVSPFAANFTRVFADQVRVGTQSLFGDLCQVLPGVSASAVLANAWAVAASNPLWLALLARSVDGCQEQELCCERDRLLALSRQIMDAEPFALAIRDVDPATSKLPPDLGASRLVIPGLRLRYALANKWAQGAAAKELLWVAGNQPNASTWLRARELHRAMRATAEQRDPLRPLSAKEFKALPPRLQALAISRPDLATMLVPRQMLADAGLHARVQIARSEATKVGEMLRQLRGGLDAQSLTQVVPLLQALSPNEATIDQAKVALAGLGKLPKKAMGGRRRGFNAKPVQPRESDNPAMWSPLAPTSKRLLLRLVPGYTMPTWWSCTASEVAAGIAAGRIRVAEVPTDDLARIQRAWGPEEHAKLCAAECYDLVPSQADVWDRLTLTELCEASTVHPPLLERIAKRPPSLEDARSVLTLLGTARGSKIRAQLEYALNRRFVGAPRTSWGLWVARCIGTPDWEKTQRKSSLGVHPLREGLALLASGQQPLDGAGFRNALCGMLTAAACPDADLRDGLVAFWRHDKQLLDPLLQAVDVSRLRRVLQQHDLPSDLLSRLGKVCPVDLRHAIWEARLRKVSSATQLRELVLEHPDQWNSLRWEPRWLSLPGDDRDKALPMVLAARQSPKLLSRLARLMKEDAFVAAVRAAADLLPVERRRERGYLQLVAALGGREITSLMAVLLRSNRKSAPGCRLDAVYREYLLPKRSGGNRVISVPPCHLKRLQRMILDKLLIPLGAHEAAFGFVPKRSILDNARVHVGQPVVANADVSNCFPSVKWPLVLGVLRRDLGAQIGLEAVSLLVDICTAKGGLPIGAPTSPALLNRVLLRTDEIVHQAAVARKCRYTRYADDLTFSGDHRAVQMLGIAKRTLTQIGLSLDEKKTTIYRPGRRQMVTGLVVNQKVGIPRRIRRRMRAAVHVLETGGQPHWHGQSTALSSTAGRLAFLCQIHPEQGARLKERWKRARDAREKTADG